MRITVFGANGKVGSLVVEEALRRRHEVVAFVHSRNLFAPSGLLTVRTGDIYEMTAVSEAMQGSDAVVSCLGSWGTPQKNVLSAAMRNIIPAMHEQNIGRIVTLTGSGAKAPGERQGFVHDLMLKVPIAGAGKVFYDGEEHMRLLTASDLRWTTLRSPVMTGGGNTNYTLNLQSAGGLICRKAVAAAMLDQLESEEFIRQAPFIRQK